MNSVFAILSHAKICKLIFVINRIRFVNFGTTRNFLCKGEQPNLEEKSRFFCAQDLTWQHFIGLKRREKCLFLIGNIYI
jgi:hypothetical protein